MRWIMSIKYFQFNALRYTWWPDSVKRVHKEGRCSAPMTSGSLYTRWPPTGFRPSYCFPSFYYSSTFSFIFIPPPHTQLTNCQCLGNVLIYAFFFPLLVCWRKGERTRTSYLSSNNICLWFHLLIYSLFILFLSRPVFLPCYRCFFCISLFDFINMFQCSSFWVFLCFCLRI